MAARDNVYQLYNGSAAYDLNRYSGTAAPEIQSPGLPEERQLPRKQQRVKVKAAVAPTALLGMMVITCMLILVIFGYVQLYEATEQVSSLESELSSLMQQQVILESLYEGGIDLDYIEERAAELGLSVPSKDQTVYLNLSGTDRAEIYASENVSFIQRVIQAIQSSAGGLVEYLS
ncbi:MAG: hypothetical protein IKK44_00755, partial [Clostridium sp.]|nr:hypothetical protein [Clostridium sp.]